MGLTTNDLTSLTYRVLLALEEGEGLITPEIEAMLDQVEGETPAKMDALRWVAEAAKADAAHLKAEGQKLTAAAKARETLATSIKARALLLLTAHGELTGSPKVKSTSHSYWTASTVSVVGPESSVDWPEAYRRRKVTITPDKTAAKKALQAGEEVPGVHLETSTGIRWR